MIKCLGKKKIGVIGLGYVGLKESIHIAKAGFEVIGFDIAETKIDLLNKSLSPISTVSNSDVSEYLKSGSSFTKSIRNLQGSRYYYNPSANPLDNENNPDLTYIEKAINFIKEIYVNQIIVLESTSYPGCSREMIGDEIYNSFGNHQDMVSVRREKILEIQ